MYTVQYTRYSIHCIVHCQLWQEIVFPDGSLPVIIMQSTVNCSVHCTLSVYSVQCTVYTLLLHCTLQCTVCTLQCTVLGVLQYSTTVYTVHCSLYSVHCTLNSVLNTAQFAVYFTVYCVPDSHKPSDPWIQLTRFTLLQRSFPAVGLTCCALYTVHCTVYSVHFPVCTDNCPLCTLNC